MTLTINPSIYKLFLQPEKEEIDQSSRLEEHEEENWNKWVTHERELMCVWSVMFWLDKLVATTN